MMIEKATRADEDEDKDQPYLQHLLHYDDKEYIVTRTSYYRPLTTLKQKAIIPTREVVIVFTNKYLSRALILILLGFLQGEMRLDAYAQATYGSFYSISLPCHSSFTRKRPLSSFTAPHAQLRRGVVPRPTLTHHSNPNIR